MQTYIIKSFSYRILKEELDKLIQNNNVINYDAEETALKDILEECNYISLFNEKKYVVVKNMKYFSNKGEYKKENELIEKYLQQENSNTFLIFIVNELNLKNKNVKKIKENNNLIVIDKLTKKDLSLNIKKYLTKNKYEITSEALDLLEKKCIDNYDIILNELDKIFLIKENKLITLDDIKNNCSYFLEENFDFINAVSSKNRNMFKELSKLEELKIEPTIILGQIINQFKLMYTVLTGLTEISEQELANELKIHPFRIKLAKENGFRYGISNIENILDTLEDLDLKIKGDFPNKYLLIKNFLLELID